MLIIGNSRQNHFYFHKNNRIIRENIEKFNLFLQGIFTLNTNIKKNVNELKSVGKKDGCENDVSHRLSDAFIS